MSCNKIIPVCNLKRESLSFSKQEISEFIDDPVTKQMFWNKWFSPWRRFSTDFSPALSPIIPGPEQHRLAVAGSGTPSFAYNQRVGGSDLTRGPSLKAHLAFCKRISQQTLSSNFALFYSHGPLWLQHNYFSTKIKFRKGCVMSRTSVLRQC